MHALAPLLLAASGLPALLVGAWVGRSGNVRSRGMALHWVMIGLAMQAGAVRIYFSEDGRQVRGIVIAMVVLVNALIASMAWQLHRNRKSR